MFCRLCSELNNCAWNSDLCVYVYCAERLAHIECYTDYSRMGAIWLNPFVTVLFNVCRDGTVVHFPICVALVCLVYFLL